MKATLLSLINNYPPFLIDNHYHLTFFNLFEVYMPLYLVLY